MKIWKIEQVENLYYDANWAHIIEAETEERVREMAAEEAADEGQDVWLNKNYSSVKLIGKSNSSEEKVWLSEFHAG